MMRLIRNYYEYTAKVQANLIASWVEHMILDSISHTKAGRV